MTTSNQKTNEAVLESLRGTFLAPVFFATDEEIQSAFKDLKAPDPKKEEKEIGELTPAEKGIWYAKNLLNSNIDKILEKKPDNFKELDEVVEKAKKIKNQAESLNDFFWEMIRSRIPEADAANTIGIRNAGDGRIVVIEVKKDREEESIFDLPFGIGIIKIKHG